jgi:hypothetical protein
MQIKNRPPRIKILKKNELIGVSLVMPVADDMLALQ